MRLHVGPSRSYARVTPCVPFEGASRIPPPRGNSGSKPSHRARITRHRPVSFCVRGCDLHPGFVSRPQLRFATMMAFPDQRCVLRPFLFQLGRRAGPLFRLGRGERAFGLCVALPYRPGAELIRERLGQSGQCRSVASKYASLVHFGLAIPYGGDRAALDHPLQGRRHFESRFALTILAFLIGDGYWRAGPVGILLALTLSASLPGTAL